MSNPKEVLRKKMEGKTQYEYCPYCISIFLKDGADYKASVPPMFLIKTEEYLPEIDKYREEKYWLCPRCQKKITEETMIEFYACRFDRTRLKHNSKPFMQRVRGTDEMIKVFISSEGQEIKQV